MPRKARLIAPGCIYHVMARSLDGVMLFRDDHDRAQFLRLLESYLCMNVCRCYAWALMGNHYHLVLRPGEAGLAPVMKPLNMRYAQYHGRKYHRRGYLFFDRFRSIASQDQGYIEQMVRYVHLNPVRSGDCRDLRALDRYAWTGHSALMGHLSRPFQDTSTVLRKFSRSVEDARAAYREFLADGLASGDEDGTWAVIRRSNASQERGRQAGCWVIGDPEFVKRALAGDRARRLRVSRFEREGWTLDRLQAEIAARFGVPAARLGRRSRGGETSAARKCFAYVACCQFGLKGSQVARHLGVGGASISTMLREGEQIASRRRIAI